MQTNTLPPPNPSAFDLLTAHEAAAMLKTNPRTLANWRNLKQGPRFVKVGARMVRYPRAALAEFIGTGAA